jgi:hypothetical protein
MASLTRKAGMLQFSSRQSLLSGCSQEVAYFRGNSLTPGRLFPTHYLFFFFPLHNKRQAGDKGIVSLESAETIGRLLSVLSAVASSK